MANKHTPGPWSAVEHYSDSVSVVDAQGFAHVDAAHIAVLLGYSDKLGIPHWADSPEASRDISEEEQAANARLIAAAPDLLEACQEMKLLLDMVLCVHGGLPAYANGPAAKALSAIRKATGA